MIAVMGAAGNVGRQVADRLLRENEEVRALEHRRPLDDLAERGAHVVRGDAGDVEALRALVDGADAALVLLPEDLADPAFAATRSGLVSSLASALRDRPVGHVVALSAAVVDREDVAGPPVGLRELERALGELEDANVLALRSAFYMDYVLAALPLIRSQGVNGSAVAGDVALPMVATRDVAAAAAERLRRRDFTGHVVEVLLGPEDVTMREVTRMLGSLLDLPALEYVEFPPAEMRAGLVASGMSDEAASLLVDMQVALGRGRWFDGIRRTGATVAPTTLERFLTEALAERRIDDPVE